MIADDRPLDEALGSLDCSGTLIMIGILILYGLIGGCIVVYRTLRDAVFTP